MMLVPLSPEQLREALDGQEPGGTARGWRLLREDVRALAPPLDPAFERELYARLAAAPERHAAPRRRGHAWAARSGKAQLLAGAGAAVCVLLIALAAGIFTGSKGGVPVDAKVKDASPRVASAESSSPATDSLEALGPASGPHKAQAAPATSAPAAPSASSSASAPAAPSASSSASTQAASSAPARVQERAASITLAAKPTEVQAVADGVSRLASSEGGYVVSSQVNVQSRGKGEAAITLSLPSTHLEQALAALGRLAPVRAQSNSLQDITSSYESAKRALADAVAERSGLLRALARATTQGQIESLRRRLSLAGGAIARGTAALQSVSRRAAGSRVEVSVVSSPGSAEAGGSTLSRGLHEAGHVLAVVLAGLLIALAVLVPVGLLGALVALAGRRWRRWQRERVLGGNPRRAQNP